MVKANRSGVIVDADLSTKAFREISISKKEEALLLDDKTPKYVVLHGDYNIVMYFDGVNDMQIYVVRSYDNKIADVSLPLSYEKLPVDLNDDQFAVRIKDSKHIGCVYYVVFMYSSAEGKVEMGPSIYKTFEWIRVPALKKIGKISGAQFVWTIGPVSFSTKLGSIVNQKKQINRVNKDRPFIQLDGDAREQQNQEEKITEVTEGKISMHGWDC